MLKAKIWQRSDHNIAVHFDDVESIILENDKETGRTLLKVFLPQGSASFDYGYWDFSIGEAA